MAAIPHTRYAKCLKTLLGLPARRTVCRPIAAFTVENFFWSHSICARYLGEPGSLLPTLWINHD